MLSATNRNKLINNHKCLLRINSEYLMSNVNQKIKTIFFL